MSYSKALAAAGAKVIAYEEFGSYQGTWMALVEYKGQTGITEGSYGSCSGCDAFQAEFDYGDTPAEEDGKYYRTGRTWDEDDECTKEEYGAAMARYQERLAAFGEGYLQNLSTKDIIETRIENLKKDDWFSDEDKESLEWALNQLRNVNS